MTKTVWLKEGTNVSFELGSKGSCTSSNGVVTVTGGEPSKLWYDNKLQAQAGGGQGAIGKTIADSNVTSIKVYSGNNASSSSAGVHRHAGNPNAYGGCYVTPVYHQHTGAFAVHGDSISPVHDGKTYGYISDWEWHGRALKPEDNVSADGKQYVPLSAVLAGSETAVRVDGCFEYFACPGQWFSTMVVGQGQDGNWDHEARCSYMNHGTQRPFNWGISPIRYEPGDMMAPVCPYILCRRICGKTTASVDYYQLGCGLQQYQILNATPMPVGSSVNTWNADTAVQSNQGDGKLSIELVEQGNLSYLNAKTRGAYYLNDIVHIMIMEEPKTKVHYAAFVKH